MPCDVRASEVGKPSTSRSANPRKCSPGSRAAKAQSLAVKQMSTAELDNHARTDPDHRARPRRLGRCLRLERGHPATAGIPPAELTFMAKRAGAHITELNAGHRSMIANPETVAQVIEQAATETT